MFLFPQCQNNVPISWTSYIYYYISGYSKLKSMSADRTERPKTACIKLTFSILGVCKD